ncbi:MAG: adenylate/guanylate cyclase domain-containing protein [Pseudomonadales bacterium]
MKWIDSWIAWLAPTVLVEGTPWRAMWEESDRRAFINIARIFFPLVAVAYLAHFFFYDLPNDLEPIQGWFRFRLTIAVMALFTTAFYFSRYADRPGTRAPAIIACWIMCQSQAFVVVVHGLESWVFCFVLIVGSVMVLRLSAALSLVFVLVTVGSQAWVLLGNDFPTSYIFTGSVVTAVMAIIIRAPYLADVKNFLLNQQNIAAQKQIIELNLEFSERIRSFIPLVIAKRLERSIEDNRMSVLEASIDVMAPQVKSVACLFSDIRGFTQGSKDLDQFVQGGVLPEVKACSDAIEENEGIPRKVGDLIFAYFDQPRQDNNLLLSAVAAMEIARLNQDMNRTFSSVTIKRYVLLASGEAVVGNLGGAGSSIEITALGSPVNLLSRIDEATKAPRLSAILEQGDLITTKEFSAELDRLVVGIEKELISISDLGVELRDFPEVTSLILIKPSDHNYQLLQTALMGAGGGGKKEDLVSKKLDSNIAA